MSDVLHFGRVKTVQFARGPIKNDFVIVWLLNEKVEIDKKPAPLA